MRTNSARPRSDTDDVVARERARLERRWADRPAELSTILANLPGREETARLRSSARDLRREEGELQRALDACQALRRAMKAPAVSWFNMAGRRVPDPL